MTIFKEDTHTYHLGYSKMSMHIQRKGLSSTLEMGKWTYTFNWKCLEQVGTHLNYFSINQLTKIFYCTTTETLP